MRDLLHWNNNDLVRSQTQLQHLKNDFSIFWLVTIPPGGLCSENRTRLYEINQNVDFLDFYFLDRMRNEKLFTLKNKMMKPFFKYLLFFIAILSLVPAYSQQ